MKYILEEHEIDVLKKGLSITIYTGREEVVLFVDSGAFNHPLATPPCVDPARLTNNQKLLNEIVKAPGSMAMDILRRSGMGLRGYPYLSKMKKKGIVRVDAKRGYHQA